MKKVLLILLCSFVSFAFTNEETKLTSESENSKIAISTEVEIQAFSTERGTIFLTATDDGICERGSTMEVISKDCDGDGVYDYVFIGRLCVEHIAAMWQQLNASCGN